MQSARRVQSAHTGGDGTVRSMRDLLVLAVHLLVTCAKLLRPGGVRAVAAESLLLKHQLLMLVATDFTNEGAEFVSENVEQWLRR